MEEIPFDDIDALREKISGEFGSFGPAIEVTQAMIDAFADLTGDHQWIHVDVERCARESPFGAPIAHGFLTLSLLPRLSSSASEPWRIAGMGNVTNYGSDVLRFLAPVPAGSKIHCRKRLKAVDATDKGTRVVRELALHVVGSERPALFYEMIALYQPARR